MSLDFYPTPAAVAAAGAAIVSRFPLPVGKGVILDPCAGVGSLLDALPPHIETHAIEIESSFAPALVRHHPVIGDALLLSWPTAHVFMNPPYALLDDFVIRAIDHVLSYNTRAAVLVRDTWFASARHRRLERYRPSELHWMPWRPSFDGKGTDFGTYFWAVFASERPPAPRMALVPRPQNDTVSEQRRLYARALALTRPR